MQGDSLLCNGLNPGPMQTFSGSHGSHHLNLRTLDAKPSSLENIIRENVDSAKLIIPIAKMGGKPESSTNEKKQ